MHLDGNINAMSELKCDVRTAFASFVKFRAQMRLSFRFASSDNVLCLFTFLFLAPLQPPRAAMNHFRLSRIFIFVVLLSGAASGDLIPIQQREYG